MKVSKQYSSRKRYSAKRASIKRSVSPKKLSIKKRSVKRSVSPKKLSIKKGSVKKSVSPKKLSIKKGSVKKSVSPKKQTIDSGYKMRGMGVILNMYGGASEALEEQIKVKKRELADLKRQLSDERSESRRRKISAAIKEARRQIAEDRDRLHQLLRGVSESALKAAASIGERVRSIKRDMDEKRSIKKYYQARADEHISRKKADKLEEKIMDTFKELGLTKRESKSVQTDDASTSTETSMDAPSMEVKSESEDMKQKSVETPKVMASTKVVSPPPAYSEKDTNSIDTITDTKTSESSFFL